MAEFDSIATRLSLLTRLKNWDDRESWEVFFETYWRFIYGIAVKSGLGAQEAEEVVQDVVLELSRRIKDFKYDPKKGAFKNWLLQLTRWRIRDQFRKRSPHLCLEQFDHSDKTEVAEGFVLPGQDKSAQQWEQDWQENLMQSAIENLRKKLAPEHFQVLNLLVTRRWPVREVARAVGLSTSNVYMIKFRVLARLKSEIKRLEKDYT